MPAVEATAGQLAAQPVGGLSLRGRARHSPEAGRIRDAIGSRPTRTLTRLATVTDYCACATRLDRLMPASGRPSSVQRRPFRQLLLILPANALIIHIATLLAQQPCHYNSTCFLHRFRTMPYDSQRKRSGSGHHVRCVRRLRCIHVNHRAWITSSKCTARAAQAQQMRHTRTHNGLQCLTDTPHDRLLRRLYCAYKLVISHWVLLLLLKKTQAIMLSRHHEVIKR